MQSVFGEGRIVGSKFVVDHAGVELDVAFHDGQPRILGCLPPREDFGGLPKFRSALPTIPRSEWKEFTFAGHAVPILNQGQTGSCVGHAAVEAFWRQWLIQNLPIPGSGFSACWTYAQINGGFDGGAVISDAMTSLIDDGVALLSDVPEGMIFKRRISNYASVSATARRYKAKAAYHCETFDDIGSALQQGLMVVYAVRAGGSWDVDPNTGIVQFIRGAGNHAQHGRGMKKINGLWYIDDQNSWGDTWGIDGCCYVGEKHIANSGQDAFALQFDTPDPQGPHLPPVAA